MGVTFDVSMCVMCGKQREGGTGREKGKYPDSQKLGVAPRNGALNLRPKGINDSHMWHPPSRENRIDEGMPGLYLSDESSEKSDGIFCLTGGMGTQP